MKICSECQHEKSLDHFHRNKSNKDGYNYSCKDCAYKYQKKYYQEHKENIKQRHAKWRDKNKDKIKDYYIKNKEKFKEAEKQRYLNNKKIIKNSVKRYNSMKALYETYAPQIKFCEKIRKDPINSKLLQVKCTELTCRKWFNPTNLQILNRIRALNGKIRGELRFYCSDTCKQDCTIYGRKKYPKDFKPNHNREVQTELRDLVFERDNYECQKCGDKKEIQCHHFEGIEQNPIESADIDMCVTLCRTCHKEAHKDIGCRPIDLRCG